MNKNINDTTIRSNFSILHNIVTEVEYTGGYNAADIYNKEVANERHRPKTFGELVVQRIMRCSSVPYQFKLAFLSAGWIDMYSTFIDWDDWETYDPTHSEWKFFNPAYHTVVYCMENFTVTENIRHLKNNVGLKI